MISTIVFDLGGVLFSEGKSLLLNSLREEDRAHIQKIFSSQHIVALRKGLLSEKDFWSWAQEQLPKECSAMKIRAQWYGSYILDKDVLMLVHELRKRYRLVIFSGNIRERIDFLDGAYAFRKYFDGEVYSFEHHMDKPNSAFIDVMIRQAGVAPQSIVYIDDKEYNVAPARAKGVNALTYTSGEISFLKEKLRALGVEC